MKKRCTCYLKVYYNGNNWQGNWTNSVLFILSMFDHVDAGRVDEFGQSISGFLGRLDMFLWIARWSCMVDRRDNVPEVKHFGWHKYYLRDSHYRDTVVDYSCTLMTGYDDACNICVQITDTFITH